ncbi:hypothetical protein KCP78_14015 [Salmonella enterica subsp. enterica]|nr:hypothetical protein KCP78_14015 [Salmonella enterica subsp. enterica]
MLAREHLWILIGKSLMRAVLLPLAREHLFFSHPHTSIYGLSPLGAGTRHLRVGKSSGGLSPLARGAIRSGLQCPRNGLSPLARGTHSAFGCFKMHPVYPAGAGTH